MLPAATTAAFIPSTPKPFNVAVSNCLSSLSSAASVVYTQSSSSNTLPLYDRCWLQNSLVPFMRSSSLGWNPESILSASSTAASPHRNSPVEMSSSATPTDFLSTWIAARKLFSFACNAPVALLTPGVTSSVIPLLTSFFVSFGSSSCSQMATRLPALTSFGRYESRAWWGNPASSTLCAFPLALRVSVIPRISLAAMASSEKVS